MLKETHIRVYITGTGATAKVNRCDGDYARKATDVRYVVIPQSTHELRAVGRTRTKPSVLAAEFNVECAVNFPYFNEGNDYALIGQAIVEGTPLSYETGKTRNRAEFYADESGYHIGVTPSPNARLALQGSPELLRDGIVVVAESLKRDALSISATDRSQRTAVGIRANGDVILLVADGRLTSDIGLTFEELALVFRDELACVSAINGDGGGSSILYVKDRGVINQRTNRENERATGCALIAVKKAVVTLPEPSAVKPLKLTIDAGHGLNTNGKRCPDDSMREHMFNSVVARYLADELAQYNGIETVFTHDITGITDVSLAERVRKANDWKADVFVSIHANAYGPGGWNDVSGIETFTSTHRSAASVKLADNVQKRLIAVTGAKDRGVRSADFYVIARTNMPAILTECGGFMTNKADADRMKTDAYRKLCAKILADSIAEVYGLKRKATERSISVTDTQVIDERSGKEYAAILHEGVTYAPVRDIAESNGRTVEWDGKNVILRK